MGSVTVGALLFDNDGVLVDSDPGVFAAWSTWATEHGLEPADVVPQVHGRRAEDTVGLLIAPVDRAAALARIMELELEAAAGTVAMPGALQLLDSLAGQPWAVVTSATRDLATARLEAAGLPFPSVLVTADDVAAGKPAPDGFQAAAARLGNPTAQCVVFEDSDAGIAAAHAAEVAVVVGVNLRDSRSRAWAQVADLSEVTCRPSPDGRLLLDVAAT